MMTMMMRMIVKVMVLMIVLIRKKMIMMVMMMMMMMMTTTRRRRTTMMTTTTTTMMMMMMMITRRWMRRKRRREQGRWEEEGKLAVWRGLKAHRLNLISIFLFPEWISSEMHMKKGTWHRSQESIKQERSPELFHGCFCYTWFRQQNSGAFLGTTKETKTPFLAPSGPTFWVAWGGLKWLKVA